MRTVLVTGACINTGVAIVEKFLAEGCRVIFTGRNKKNVLEARDRYMQKFADADVEGYTIDSHNSEGNVDEKSVSDMFAYLDSKGVAVDTLVLNAVDQGLGIKVLENELSDFIKVINTNMIWNYCLCEYAAKRMVKNGGGSIIFINSNTAYRAIPDRVAYSASKSGQLGMMRALALDLGKYNIRVNAVLPGMIKTNRWIENPSFYENVPSRFTPLGDVAEGSDVADAVWYFAYCARNTTGAELVVDGGNTIQLYPIIKNKEEDNG